MLLSSQEHPASSTTQQAKRINQSPHRGSLLHAKHGEGDCRPGERPSGDMIRQHHCASLGFRGGLIGPTQRQSGQIHHVKSRIPNEANGFAWQSDARGRIERDVALRVDSATDRGKQRASGGSLGRPASLDPFSSPKTLLRCDGPGCPELCSSDRLSHASMPNRGNREKQGVSWIWFCPPQGRQGPFKVKSAEARWGWAGQWLRIHWSIAFNKTHSCSTSPQQPSEAQQVPASPGLHVLAQILEGRCCCSAAVCHRSASTSASSTSTWRRRVFFFLLERGLRLDTSHAHTCRFQHPSGLNKFGPFCM